LWRCAITSPDPEPAWSSYLDAKSDLRVRFVAFSIQEIPDVALPEVTVENFPWGEWELIQSAVRRADGEWEERGGHSAQD
jgi:hypothetical protein